MRVIVPAHGSEELNARASCGVVSRPSSGPWMMCAFGAKSFAAAALSFRFNAALQARTIAGREIEPHAAAWDREHRFPRELFAKLADLGLMGVCVPEEYGGAGADFLSYVLVLEELSRADAGVGVTVAVHTSAATLPLLAYGTDEQRARFVPPLARGEQIGAFALTEPEAGSDAGALRTRADAA